MSEFYKAAREEMRRTNQLLRNIGEISSKSVTLECYDTMNGPHYFTRNRKNGIMRQLNAKEAKAIMTDRYNRVLRERLKSNKMALSIFLKTYRPWSPNDIWKSLPKAYWPSELRPRKNVSKAKTIQTNMPDDVFREWLSSSFHSPVRISPNRNRLPVDKPQFSSMGTLVRSKSESIIASILEGLGINYLYDHYIELMDDQGAPIYRCPDFIILCPDGEVFFHEHLGRLNDRNYCIANTEKLHLYSTNNILPGQNLILSSEGQDGTFDANAVRIIYRALVLPHYEGR